MSDLRNPVVHDDLLNYQLKRLVSAGGAPAVRLYEGRYGVSRFEWRLIAALVEDGPMSPSDLATRTHFEPGRVSRALGAIAAKRLVQRSVHPDNRRRVTFAATTAGERLYAQLFPQLAQINRRLMAALDDHEARILSECLRKLTERADEIMSAGGGVDARADRRLGGTRRFWD